VDCKHVHLHFDDMREVREQIGFADVILLNKTDLVSPAELEQLQARIRKMNAVARIYTCQNGQVDLEKVLKIGGFDLNRALELEPDFLKAEDHEDEHHDHDHDHECHDEACTNPEHHHEHDHEEDHHHEHDHHHADDITSVGISEPGDLDEALLSEWLGNMLKIKGQDIFRMKGILSFKDRPQRFVFQGVHMLLDKRADREWGTDARHNTLVFIGRDLDRESIKKGFAACLAK
jgi:G3E family GTPase